MATPPTLSDFRTRYPAFAAVADGYKCEPPREVTFPIRPQNFSVGLFTAAIYCNMCADEIELDLP